MKIFFGVILIILLSGCQDDPDESYPIEPQIKFSKIEYNDGLDNIYDTLAITFSFTDGDADFGLDYGDQSYALAPYQDGFFFLKDTGEKITSDRVYSKEIGVDQVIKFSDKSNPPFDTLPDLSTGCGHYVPFSPSGNFGDQEDLYWQRNENYNNFFVDFYYDDGGGDLVEFDLYQQFCMQLDARISINKGTLGPFIIKMANSNRGEITYRMVSPGFVPIFGEKKMKLEFFIQDRALHKSNIIETPTFLLSEI